MAETALATSAPAAAPETPAAEGAPAVDTAVKPAVKERVFLIDGKEWPESKLAQRIQKAEGLEKRVADADKYEKAFNSFVERTQDPNKFIELLNTPDFQYDEEKQASLVRAMLGSKKPKLIAAVKEWLYENEVEPASMTAEQRRLRELENENKQFKTRAQQQEDEQKTLAQQAEQTRIWNDYRVKIGAGIKTEGLPETEGMVVRIARKAMLQRRANQPADIATATKMVKAELQAEYLQNMESASDEQILSLLPESLLKKINTAFLKRIKKVEQEPIEDVAGRPVKKVKAGDEKKNKDFWRNIGRGIPVT